MKNYRELLDITLNESSLSRVQRAWKGYDTGTITAFRYAKDCGEGEKYTTRSNKDRNSVLKSKLLGAGFGVTKVKGAWLESGEIEVGEESFFVVDLKKTGKLKKILKKYGYEFEQDAIVYADVGEDYYAIGTNECPKAWPGFNKVEKLGKPKFGKSGIEGFSRINGRAFVFESNDIVTLTDYPPSEIRSIKHIDEIDISKL